VLGRRKDRVLRTLITCVPNPFDVAVGDPRMSGIIVRLDPATGRAAHIERIRVDGVGVAPGDEESDNDM
jgi:calcineurin-like phosphoesterase